MNFTQHQHQHQHQHYHTQTLCPQIRAFCHKDDTRKKLQSKFEDWNAELGELNEHTHAPIGFIRQELKQIAPSTFTSTSTFSIQLEEAIILNMNMSTNNRINNMIVNSTATI
jgi:hypothetical protein